MQDISPNARMVLSMGAAFGALHDTAPSRPKPLRNDNSAVVSSNREQQAHERRARRNAKRLQKAHFQTRERTS